MKNKTRLVLFCVASVVASQCKAQNSICVQISERDFGIHAFQKHNEICKVIFDNIKNKKLGSYNVKNMKEPYKETIGKISVKTTVFIQTDRNDPTIGKDSSLMIEESDNYHLFKTSNDYILLKPFKGSNNLLKLNKAELFTLLSSDQKEYFNAYTTNFLLCIDSIPVISKRLFDYYNVKLFEFSKLPVTKLFVNDSLTTSWSAEDKANLSQDQYMAFIATDPDDPTIGHDTIILYDYNIGDTTKEHEIVFMLTLNGYKIRVNSVSCGLERKLMGYMDVIIPFGYLPYQENLPFSATEMKSLDSILHIKMTDALNLHKNNEDSYDDYFGDND